MAEKPTPEIDERTVTKDELRQVDRANTSGRHPSCSCTGCGCWPGAGTAGPSWSRPPSTARCFSTGGTTPDTVGEAKAHTEVLAGKSIGRIADHCEAVIRKLDRKPAPIGHRFGGRYWLRPGRRGCLGAVGGHRPGPLSTEGSGRCRLRFPARWSSATPPTRGSG